MTVRKLLKKPLVWALGRRWLREKLAFELRRDYYRDLQVIIPLSHGMSCPLARADYVHSFTEVFLSGEYGAFLDEMPLPRRWVDLGCHAGFFSAHLAWQWRRAGSEDFSALLVDADPRVGDDVRYLIELNHLEKQFRFRAGSIKTGAGEVRFGVREGMGSSTDLSTQAQSIASVPIIGPDELLQAFAPPYDLLKIDVEGAEFDFIDSYEAVLNQSRHVIAEWHSWDAEGSNEGRMRDLMAKRGFEMTRVLQPRKNHVIEGKPLSAGCHLYRQLKTAARFAA